MKFALLSAWHVHTAGFVQKAIDAGSSCVCVWDIDETRGKRTAEKFETSFIDDLDEVLSNPEVQAVVVEAPTTMHKEIIIKAANAKKHIFTDKALTLSVKDALEIKSVIQENKVKYALSLESKAHDIYIYAKKVVESGNLGQVVSAYFRRSHGGVIQGNLPKYWFDKEQTGGGATLDLGCHGLTLLPLFCGKPKKVTCLMNELFKSGVDEQSTVVIEFENGALGTSYTSFLGSKLDNFLEIVGTNGTLQIIGSEDTEQSIYLQSNLLPEYKERKLVSLSILEESNPYPIEEFVNLVDQSNEMEIPGYDMDTSIMLTRLIECAYESQEKRATITF